MMIAHAIVRPLEPGDADAILDIQKESLETAQWSKSAYERLAQEKMAGWVAELGANVCGFLVARPLAGEVEILNFAVAPGARQRGTGGLLLAALLAWARETRTERIHLEVRASNQSARRFYQRHGFTETGRRPRYYSAPVEDAMLLALDLEILPG